MMEMWGEWLPWIVGIAIVSALLNRSRGRRYRRRGHRSARRGRAPRRHGQGPRFPREALPGRIVRITDGDGLVAEVAGFGRLNIRLAHMDAPEYDQPWGEEAKHALRRLSRRGGCRFRLLARDRYARVVAVVHAGDVMLNEELVRQGHAWVYARYVPSHLLRRYSALEREARQARTGLWGSNACPVPPWEWRRRPQAGLLGWLWKLLRSLFHLQPRRSLALNGRYRSPAPGGISTLR